MSDNVQINANFINEPGRIVCDNGLVWTDGSGNLHTNSNTTNFSARSVSATTPDPANSTVVANNPAVQRFTPTAARTALDIAAGTVNGQVVTIVNEQTVVADTLSFSGAHILLDASSDAIIVKAASFQDFIWLTDLNSGAGLWVHQGPFAG